MRVARGSERAVGPISRLNWSGSTTTTRSRGRAIALALTLARGARGALPTLECRPD